MGRWTSNRRHARRPCLTLRQPLTHSNSRDLQPRISTFRINPANVNNSPHPAMGFLDNPPASNRRMRPYSMEVDGVAFTPPESPASRRRTRPYSQKVDGVDFTPSTARVYATRRNADGSATSSNSPRRPSTASSSNSDTPRRLGTTASPVSGASSSFTSDGSSSKAPTNQAIARVSKSTASGDGTSTQREDPALRLVHPALRQRVSWDAIRRDSPVRRTGRHPSVVWEKYDDRTGLPYA